MKDYNEPNVPIQQSVNIYLKNYHFMRKRAKEKGMSITSYLNKLIEEDRNKTKE